MQVTAQQQEMAVLDRQLGHKKEELHLLQESMVQAKADLQEALTLGETEVTEKCNYIRVCFPVDFLKSPRIVLGYRFILRYFYRFPPKCKCKFPNLDSSVSSVWWCVVWLCCGCHV